jgi:hypothetical protein
MKKVILSVLALSVAAFISGCTPTCEANKPIVKPAPAPVIVDEKTQAVG